MDDYIKINQANGTWVVRAAGAVIAESKQALELNEGSYPAVIYFPQTDIAMAFLEPSDKGSHCPHKGDAVYYSIHSKSGEIPNAAWCYDTPLPAVAPIAGHLAFYQSDRVTVEKL